MKEADTGITEDGDERYEYQEFKGKGGPEALPKAERPRGHIRRLGRGSDWGREHGDSMKELG
jgi:hypothetical protein